MHCRSESDLRIIARKTIQEREDIDDAWVIFLDEARAHYNPEDDGDGDEYLAEVKEVFEEEKAALVEAA
jgi:hypothetical protein